MVASFSGGVSLAIWMGGLTYELDRLLRSSDAERHHRKRPQEEPLAPADTRYAALLSLLKLDVDVDVITGTSAGGINGAALAMARVHGSRVEPLRKIWEDKGSFTNLLRSIEKNGHRPSSVATESCSGPPGCTHRDPEREGPRAGEGRRTAVGPGYEFKSRRNKMVLLIT